MIERVARRSVGGGLGACHLSGEGYHWGTRARRQPFHTAEKSFRKISKNFQEEIPQKTGRNHSGEKSDKCNQYKYASSLTGNFRRHLKAHRRALRLGNKRAPTSSNPLSHFLGHFSYFLILQEFILRLCWQNED